MRWVQLRWTMRVGCPDAGLRRVRMRSSPWWMEERASRMVSPALRRAAMSEIPVWSPRCLPAGSTPIHDKGVNGLMDLMWVMCSLRGTPACTYSWVTQRVLCWSSDAKRTTVGARMPKSMPAMVWVMVFGSGS